MQILLNYLPLRAGTFYAAHKFHSQHAVTYSKLAAIFAGQTCIVSAATCVAAAIALGWHPAIGSLNGVMLFLVLVSIGAIAIALVALPIPGILWSWLPGSEGLNRVHSGLRAIGRPRLIILAFGLSLVSFLLGVTRMAIAFEAVGFPVTPAELVVLGAVSHLSLYVSLTPSAIGFREAAIGVTAVIFDSSLETGVLAATIDRFIILMTLLITISLSTLIPILKRLTQKIAQRFS